MIPDKKEMDTLDLPVGLELREASSTFTQVELKSFIQMVDIWTPY
jgi:hypothetical protein